MGREANCRCIWADKTADCKALLESGELILRGDIRRRFPLASIKDISVKGNRLIFRVKGESVSLHLGAELAQKWAAAIDKLPPSLSHKLGISNGSRILVIGVVEDGALKAALAEAGGMSGDKMDLVVACVDTPAKLDQALHRFSDPALLAIPIWIIYPKGAGTELGETAIRSTMRERGYVDTKVASVSVKLTALRFVKLRGQ